MLNIMWFFAKSLKENAINRRYRRSGWADLPQLIEHIQMKLQVGPKRRAKKPKISYLSNDSPLSRSLHPIHKKVCFYENQQIPKFGQ
jgi:hypothetical protein